MKRLYWIGLVLLAGIAAAWMMTGAEKPKGIVVVIGTLQADGPIPRPVYAHALDDGGEKRIELVPVADQPEAFLAPGAVAGHYDFFNEAGWRFINPGGRNLPFFDPAHGPVPIAMGRPYCAYVRASPASGFVLESIVVAERVEGDRKTGLVYRPVDAEIVHHDEGYIGVRLPPAQCPPKARFRISGWMSGQHPFDPITFNVGPQPRRPYLCMATPASVGRLRVVLVGGPGAQLDHVEITATLRGLPMEMTDRVTTNGGEATFPSLGAFKEGLLLEVPAWGIGAIYALDIDRWRREGTVFLRAPGSEGAQWVDVDAPPDVAIENVAVLDPSTQQFALAQVDRTPASGFRVRTVAGPQTWIVYAGKQSIAFDVVANGDRVTLPPLADSVKVYGRLRVARTGYRVRFLREVGDRWVGGTGMEVETRVGTRYEAHLPAGRYRVHVVQPGDRLTPGLTFDWPPGTNAELPLDAK